MRLVIHAAIHASADGALAGGYSRGLAVAVALGACIVPFVAGWRGGVPAAVRALVNVAAAAVLLPVSVAAVLVPRVRAALPSALWQVLPMMLAAGWLGAAAHALHARAPHRERTAAEGPSSGT